VFVQYFDHNKFSSFARQLNFYGFRKMQSKPIRNSDFDAGTAKHVTFFNENFKRGRCDLLKNIQRSTRGGGGSNQQDSQREVQNLREQVQALENRVAEVQGEMEDRMRRLELDMLARMEQMMLAVQQSGSLPLRGPSTAGASISSNSHGSSATVPMGNNGNTSIGLQQTWDPNAFPRTHSVGLNHNSSVTFQQPAPVQRQQPSTGPTLPPHPKQKQLPFNGGIMPPGAGGGGAPRLNSLRGISALTRGISGLSRGASVESSASAVVMRNSWEDKFFSMLMLGENGESQQAAGIADPSGMVGPTPLAPGATGANLMAPAMVSDQSMNIGSSSNGASHHPHGSDELSSVSDAGMP